MKTRTRLTRYVMYSVHPKQVNNVANSWSRFNTLWKVVQSVKVQSTLLSNRNLN